VSFWDEHANREADVRRVARHPQDAPALCAECDEVKPDVLLGICGECFGEYLAARHHAVHARLNGMARYQ